jgi:hypothetical protein
MDRALELKILRAYDNMTVFFEAYDRLPDKLQCKLHNQLLPEVRDARGALNCLREIVIAIGLAE